VDLDSDRDPRERNAIIEETLPGPVDDLLPLLPDRMTVRAWLREPPASIETIGGPLAQPDRLTLSELEQLAEHLHHAYVESQRARGRHDSDPALAPWSRLPSGLRASNLAAARDWVEKRAAVSSADLSCLISAAAGTDGDLGRRHAVSELLAELEHGRYVVERIRAGWGFGDRSLALQRTHTLVPWDELSEEERDKDRLAVLVCAKTDLEDSEVVNMDAV
jgi:hypothetical protein